MRKIPTLFVRDPDDRARVTREVTPGCEWVLAGQGVATRKYDGTCVLIADGLLFARREIGAGKPIPDEFWLVETDQVTGKSVGWVPVGDGPEWRWHREAIGDWAQGRTMLPDGTYELCGPKVQGNPEGFSAHVLVPHGIEKLDEDPRSFDEIADFLSRHEFEGIVWWHPDGRKAKAKRRDFRLQAAA